MSNSSHIFNIIPFGELNKRDLKNHYEAEITLAGKTIELDLNFELNHICKKRLMKLEAMTENLGQFVDKAMQVIAEDFDATEDEGTARFYLKHHVDVCSEEEVNELFGTCDIVKANFMSNLSLYSISFYPDDNESFVIFDIQFPRDFTNYLMAITLDSKGNLTDISMES